MEKVSLKELLAFGALIESETYMHLIELQLQGAKSANVPDGTLTELKRRKNEQAEKDKAISLCASLNNKGISLEKDGKIKAAIKTYEKNIENHYPAHHAYKRLMVLYHKQGDVMDEIRVLEIALCVFPDYPEYVKRLSKLKQ
ncbi:MAG: hypothetical protein RRZ64_00370 [Rikenellaceae bacterium]